MAPAANDLSTTPVVRATRVPLDPVGDLRYNRLPHHALRAVAQNLGQHIPAGVGILAPPSWVAAANAVLIMRISCIALTSCPVGVKEPRSDPESTPLCLIPLLTQFRYSSATVAITAVVYDRETFARECSPSSAPAARPSGR